MTLEKIVIYSRLNRDGNILYKSYQPVGYADNLDYSYRRTRTKIHYEEKSYESSKIIEDTC